jgi:hypothetical protein
MHIILHLIFFSNINAKNNDGFISVIISYNTLRTLIEKIITRYLKIRFKSFKSSSVL